METWVLIYVLFVQQLTDPKLPAPYAVATSTAEFTSDRNCQLALAILKGEWGNNRVIGFCAKK